MTPAHTLVWAVEIYLAFGLLFAIPFAWRWVPRLDPTAARGTTGFRLLLLPGSAALWPWRLLRLLRTRREAP